MINIYKITNSINQKVYIGQTIDTIESRFKDHCRQTFCKKLSRAIKKYGKESFIVEQLAICEGKESANCIEGFYIAVYDSVKNGYNIIEFPTSSPMTGRKHTDETKERMRKKHKVSDEGRNKLSKQRIGHKASEETKRLSSNSHKGKTLSEDQKKKISAAIKGRTTTCKGKSWKLVDGKRIWSQT